MANIDSLLKKIKEAVYGRDVRDSIHDSIKAINEEVLNYNDYVTTKANAAAQSESNAKSYMNNANSYMNTTKGYMDNSLSYMNNANNAKNAAAQSEAKAKTSETNAKASETNVSTMETNLNTKLVDAKNYIDGQASSYTQYVDDLKADSDEKIAELDNREEDYNNAINERIDNISTLIDDANKRLTNTVFSVDFTSGELVYEDTGNYNFSIDTVTGNLEYGVA